VFLAALFCEVKGLDADAKYFLTRFVQSLGTADPAGLSVKAFATRFGLSDRQVTKSLAALVACEVMTFSDTAGGRGRPKRCYRLQEGFHKTLIKVPGLPTTHHEVAVGNLLKHENRKAAQTSGKPEKGRLDVAALADLRNKRQPGQLSVVNRLLLGVLLCRADRFGIVTDLGSSELCKVVGLDQVSLKHRVRRLIDQGLIRAYVPGTTSTLFFSKMKSVYVLNLNHSELSGGGDVTSVLACVPELSLPDQMLHASNISSDVRRLKRDPQSFDGSQHLQVVRYFEGQRPSFFHLLQVMLEKYAAHLLSRYWSKLGHLPLNKRIDDPEVRDLISDDFRPSRPPLASDSNQYATLLDELYHGAYDLAIWIKEQFYQATDVPFETMDFVIIPRALNSGYSPLALLALPRSSDGRRRCLVIKQSAESELQLEFFSSESEIPLEERRRLGLLTFPGG